MANEDEDAMKPTAKEDAIAERVQELRSELEHLGRWGIVTWCDEDIVTALERSGADQTPQNIKAVREHFYGEQHVKEDLGRIPTAQDWLSQIKSQRWMYGQRIDGRTVECATRVRRPAEHDL